MSSSKKLSTTDKTELLETLKNRFENNMHRHPDVDRQDVEKLLSKNESTLRSIREMEQTGGEPDLLLDENKSFLYVDFSPESPKGRRSICYDMKSRQERKKFPPESSAQEMAEKMGIQLLTEDQYRFLQSIEPVDLKTSSRVDTPDEVRELGGAIFGDRRYDRVFFYHNGADSYYAARGFRGFVKLEK